MPPASVHIAPLGPVSAATVLFRENGKLHVSAIVKATFSFAQQGPLTIAEPDPIVGKEAHRMNNPTRSIVATSDLVPRLPGADVLLLGHAHAPGAPAKQVTVRLAVGRGDALLLDKTVVVVGDRKGAEVKPFRTMPLVYEKAFGGPGYRDNPIGTGALAGDAPPNLIDPQAENRVIGFGPISRTWPSRSVLAPPAQRAELDKPIAEIPAGFDFRYFHAAPADQRIPLLVGDEWIILEGVHPEAAQIRLELPRANAMVRVLGGEADGRTFSLRGDTLRIDADAEQCTIVFRNSFPLREADLATVRLLAGLALPDAPIEWPLHVAAPPAQASAPLPVPHLGHATSGTVLIEDAPGFSVTFSGTMELADDDMEVVEEAEVDFGSTAVLASTQVPATSPLPAFVKPPSAHEPAPVRKAARDPKEGTIDLTESLRGGRREALPFGHSASPGAVEGTRAAGPIPGSPWDPERPPAPPLGDAATFDSDALDLAGTLASPSSQSPVAPPAVAPPARVHVPPQVTAPAPVDIHSKPSAPSIFASESPDSAPTQVRHLAPPAPAAARPTGHLPAPAHPAAAESPAAAQPQSVPEDPSAPVPTQKMPKAEERPSGLADALYRRFRK